MEKRSKTTSARTTGTETGATATGGTEIEIGGTEAIETEEIAIVAGRGIGENMFTFVVTVVPITIYAIIISDTKQAR